MKGGFNLFNGKFLRESDALFTGKDLKRLNGGICESFRAEYNLVMFARANYDYLIDSLTEIGLPVPEEWNFPRFTKDVSRLLNKNHLYLAAKVTIHLIPGISGTEYLMTAEEIPGGFFPVKEGGVLIDFYEEGAKASSSYNAFEPSSRILWATATRTANSLSRHNLILINNKGFACESIEGTFGYLLDQTAVFPDREAQGYSPPILNVVKGCAEACGFNIEDRKELKREDLLNADELFLINNFTGVQPVLGLYARRYYTTGTVAIAVMLRELAREQHLSSPVSDRDLLKDPLW